MTPSNLVVAALARPDVTAPAETIDHIIAVVLVMEKEIEVLREQVLDLEDQVTNLSEE